MAVSEAITDFQKVCQKHFVCFTFATLGLRKNADWLEGSAPDQDRDMHVGTGHPDEGRWHASVKIADLLRDSREPDGYSQMIAASFVVLIYSEWDEVYRQRVAQEAKTKAKNVKCDLMGDLRLIRHCIVHNKSLISDEANKVRELKWLLVPGKLVITKEMFSDLIDQVNAMQVHVETSPQNPRE